MWIVWPTLFKKFTSPPQTNFTSLSHHPSLLAPHLECYFLVFAPNTWRKNFKYKNTCRENFTGGANYRFSGLKKLTLFFVWEHSWSDWDIQYGSNYFETWRTNGTDGRLGGKRVCRENKALSEWVFLHSTLWHRRWWKFVELSVTVISVTQTITQTKSPHKALDIKKGLCIST